jgi:hypothetical protein
MPSQKLQLRCRVPRSGSSDSSYVTSGGDISGGITADETRSSGRSTFLKHQKHGQPTSQQLIIQKRKKKKKSAYTTHTYAHPHPSRARSPFGVCGGSKKVM